MSISKASKMNGIANQLHNKKPADCGYGSKNHSVGVFGNGQEFRKAMQEALEKGNKKKEWNERITEVLKEIPDHEGYLLVRKAFIECGLRKES